MSRTRETDRVSYDGDYIYVEISAYQWQDPKAFAEDLANQVALASYEALATYERLHKDQDEAEAVDG